MPRKLTASMTFDALEDETHFTRSMLKADPDAADLVALTDGWIALIDDARGKDREARIALAEADAMRIVANARLDQACEKFGDELLLAVDKDRSAPRWTQFFGGPVGKFVRQRLAAQVAKVRAWLGSSDEVLDKHKAPLDQWSKAADQALVMTRGVSLVRGEAQTARDELAEDLTRERDGLAEALGARARVKKLGREWPALFFRVESRTSSADTSVEEPPAPSATPPA